MISGVRFRDVARTFRGPHGPIEAVRGVDFAIAPGETLALQERGKRADD